jgi:hypothetical protein
MGTPLRPIDQGPFEKSLERARTSIALEEFSAAWAEPETLTPEQTVQVVEWSAEPR